MSALNLCFCRRKDGRSVLLPLEMMLQYWSVTASNGLGLFCFLVLGGMDGKAVLYRFSHTSSLNTGFLYCLVAGSLGFFFSWGGGGKWCWVFYYFYFYFYSSAGS